MKNVLVVGAGTPAGLVIARELQSSASFRVCVADQDPHAAAFDLIARGVVLPECESDRFHTALLRACETFAVDAVIVAANRETSAVAALQADLRANATAVWLPTQTTIDVCDDRVQFSANSHAQHLSTLPTWHPAANPLSTPPFAGPWIVGPRHRSERSRSLIASTRSDLSYALDQFREPVVQQQIEGREFVIDVVSDHDGVVRGHSARWRLKTADGISTSSVTIRLAYIDHLVGPAMRSVEHRGAASIYGTLTDDGKAICTGVNPRFAAGVSLSIAAGADFVTAFVRLTLGMPIEDNQLRGAAGVRMTRFFDEIYTSQRETLRRCA